jgi:hypothetical protein
VRDRYEAAASDAQSAGRENEQLRSALHILESRLAEFQRKDIEVRRLSSIDAPDALQVWIYADMVSSLDLYFFIAVSLVNIILLVTKLLQNYYNKIVVCVSSGVWPHQGGHGGG